jgi:OFA family oxalate/formate antiporter-like MFS transporter
LPIAATTPAALKWFPPAKKGLIAGIVVAGVGLAAVWISPLTTYLLSAFGINKSFLFLGGGTIAVIAVFSNFLKNPPAGYVPAASPAAGGKKPAISAKRDYGWNEVLATRQFWQLWLMLILAASAGLMMIAHAGIIAKEQAHMTWGFMPIVLLAIFNTAGRVVSGYVSDRIGTTQTMVLAFILQAVNMFIFSHYTTPSTLLFGASFTGLCYGTIFTLMPMAVADFYGLRNLGMNYGILFTGFGLAGVVGPIVGGIIRDRSGTYSTSYLISGCLLVVAALLAFTTKAPKASAAEATKEPQMAGAK